MGGPFMTDLVLVEEEDRVLAGKDACYIIVQAIYQPL